MSLLSEKFSYLTIANAGYIDELFARYQTNPDSVEATWRYFFDGLELGTETATHSNGVAHGVIPAGTDLLGEARVAELILAYRSYGRLIASTNPLEDAPQSHPLLELARFGLSQSDLEKTFQSGKMIGLNDARLSEILARLKQVYCSTVAIETTQLSDPTERDWVLSKIESGALIAPLDHDTRKFVLRRLTEADGFERFLHTRYVAQKRFSVEGGDAVVPAVDCMIETGAELGAIEFVIGMAHRGRLNLLVNTFKKKPENILTEFEGKYAADTSLGEGDVKYHMGYSHDLTTRGGKPVHLSMAYNPSHLEFVNPVVEGMVRAKQTLLGDTERKKAVPILIHGDAAFAGQGVCYETLNLSQLEGYATGGTIHVVINNQVGFTTSPKDARSTPYCTDLARMLECPIFHVNGDDAEAVWRVSRFCAEFRQKFKKDCVMDIVCYRRHGHNEGDEPAFTQPMLYGKIKTHSTPREVYAQRLIAEGVIQQAEAQAWVDSHVEELTQAQSRTRAENPRPHNPSGDGRWKHIKRPTTADLFAPVATAVSEKKLKEIAERINHVPSDFHLHPKLARFFEARLAAIQTGKGIDWGNGEALAYATLLDEGTPVRLSGQDAERGTFTHRHSVLSDFQTGRQISPLNQIRPGQAKYSVHNSHLSETGVMGFEYGFASADPNTLVLWEAQFGDFANGAQVIIDQFLASGESKWQRMNGLVLLLPHGYEGQGPEHSSARLERFLQLSGKENLFVCNFSTPAQVFHALRRHMKRPFRKPMVVMTPKSLLRHPLAVSSLDDLTKGSFQEVIDDLAAAANPSKVTKLVLCTGKIYYDLLNEKTQRKAEDTALVRIEQLYPWPEGRLIQILNQYPSAKTILWAQEEPRNMGAWMHVCGYWNGGLADLASRVGGRMPQYVGREICASPAVGSIKIHEKEQKAVIERAFT